MALFTKKEFTDFGVAIASVIKLAGDNHPGCLARELQKREYPNRDFIPEGELEAALSQLYIANKNMFWEILRACPWNYGNNNWTNDTKVRDQIAAVVIRAGGSATAKGEFWQSLLNILQPQSTTQNPTITETKPNTTGIIALVAVAIVLLVVFFIVFKKM